MRATIPPINTTPATPATTNPTILKMELELPEEDLGFLYVQPCFTHRALSSLKLLHGVGGPQHFVGV